MTLPEFTDEELKKLDPKLVKFLKNKELWERWDQVISPTNKLEWEFFEEQAKKDNYFQEGADEVEEQWKKFQGAWRAPDGYATWLGGTKYADDYFKNHGLEFIEQISETDRKHLKDLLVKNWGVGEQEFARRIRDSNLFSDGRARRIYREERTNTVEAGARAFALNYGAKFKAWMGNHAGACQTCQSMNGQIRPINEPFSNGSMTAKGHLGCRCPTMYFLEDSTDGVKKIVEKIPVYWEKNDAGRQQKKRAEE